MATTIAQKQFNRSSPRKKNYTQTVSIAVGSLMILIGLAGFLYPEFMGLHLSVMHSFVLSGGGAVAIWAATSNDSKKAYYTDLALGIFFALNAIAGFALGEPGMPGVGYEGRDLLLVRYAPGFIELGTVDHIVHTFISIFFFTGAFSWKRRHMNTKSSQNIRA